MDRVSSSEVDLEAGALVVTGVTLSEAEHWEEGGHHVLRSTELDVIVGAPTFDEALLRFERAVIATAGYLSTIGDPADNELEMLRLIAARLARVVERCRAFDAEDAAPARLPATWRT